MMRKRTISVLLTLALIFTAFCPFTLRAEAASKVPDKYTWSEKTAPNYVVTVGKAKVSGRPAAGEIKYSKLDKYGRTGRAVGTITYDMVRESAGWREDFEEGSDPAGWGKNSIVKIKLYNGKKYKGFFWNRSHLIADSLGGRAIRTNLITGTRMQNVGANDGRGGMAYTERKTVNYLYRHHEESVYYSARPVYKGKELIPRSVIVDIKSSDNELNERVIVYNAAKGYRINYSKGTMKKSTAADGKKTVYYTVKGNKYHITRKCSGLKKAKAVFRMSKKKAVSKGLKPCRVCGMK